MTECELRSLIEESQFLNCLMNNGVDNWQGYEEACNEFSEMTESGDINEALDDYIFEEVKHEDLDPSVELNVLN